MVENESGHDFSRAVKTHLKGVGALAPAMSKPSRPSQFNDGTTHARTFFVTSSTASGRSIFQTDRMASLFVDVLRSIMKSHKINIHEFVIMRDHIHILMTLQADITLEKSMQLIKGNFSFRAKKELGFQGEIWQRGYSDVRILDELSFKKHEDYIKNNPVNAGLVTAAENYEYGSTYLKMKKRGACGPS